MVDAQSGAVSPAPKRRLRLASFRFATRGLRLLVVGEPNARIHPAATLAVVAGGLTLRISLSDWRWLVLAAGLVWTAEAINTAIEEVCDRVSPGFDAAIGRVKDVNAGGVLDGCWWRPFSGTASSTWRTRH